MDKLIRGLQDSKEFIDQGNKKKETWSAESLG